MNKITKTYQELAWEMNIQQLREYACEIGIELSFDMTQGETIESIWKFISLRKSKQICETCTKWDYIGCDQGACKELSNQRDTVRDLSAITKGDNTCSYWQK